MGEEKKEKSTSEGISSVAELKGKQYELAVNKPLGSKYTETTKAIGQYVGRIYGNEMKFLVTKGKEWEPEQPKFPKNSKADDYEQKKAIWSKEYDAWQKRKIDYQVQKGKVFNIILGRCDKALLTRVESHDKFEDWELSSDVVQLMRYIKDCMHGANDLKYQSMQAVKALKNLVLARQGENEDSLSFYERFSGAVEAAEAMFGDICPDGLIPDDKKKNDEAIRKEKEKFMAAMFMDGWDKKHFGGLLRNMENDHALGVKLYPATVEDAFQILLLHSERIKKKNGGSKESEDEGKMKLSFAEFKCWLCGEEGHKKTDCPKKAKKGGQLAHSHFLLDEPKKLADDWAG